MHRSRCFFMLLCCLSIGCDCVEVTQFFASSPVFHNENNDFPECSERVFSDEDRAVCLVRCKSDESCVGVSEDTSDQDYCFLHYNCQREIVYGEKDAPAKYYSKNCAHGGKWIPSENKCHCVDGWVGSTCQDLPHDYSDLVESGYRLGTYRTYYDLQAQGLGLVPSYAYFKPGTTYNNVNILENRGGTNFNLSWTDFRKGFFNGESNTWAGLDAWSALSQAGYTEVTAVVLFKTTGIVYRTYEGFLMSDASGGFRFSFTTSYSYGRGSIFREVDFGDCFGPHVGIPFSTFDKDVDGDADENCAATVGSGWWFSGNCANACNMFGWGPSHWGSILASQRVSVPGVLAMYVTPEEWSSVVMYVKQ